MKKIIFLSLALLSQQAFAQAVWTNTKIKRVFAGYPDKSIAFVPDGPTVNPAGCSHPTAYAIQPDHDVDNALSVIMSARITDSSVYFSVRDDVCHTIQGTDVNGVSVPVVQRIGM